MQEPKLEETITQIRNLLDSEIQELNNLILGHFVEYKELISEISEHIIRSRGKRLRALLTLLCSKMLGYSGTNHIKLAAAVELIHTATLLHDDVIDEGQIRRGKPTANALWGNKPSILCGDFLFSQSFKLMVATGSLPSLDLLSNTASIIVEGEVMQLVNLQKQTFLSKEQYFKIIDYKTAKLFASSCEVAALIMPEVRSDFRINLNKFGTALGLAYQIRDDAMDYFSNGTGKTQGQDLHEGKITLPIIMLHEKASPQDQNLIKEIFKSENRDFNAVLTLLDKYQIKAAISETIKEMSQEAIKALEELNISNQAKSLLLSLANCLEAN